MKLSYTITIKTESVIPASGSSPEIKHYSTEDYTGCDFDSAKAIMRLVFDASETAPEEAALRESLTTGGGVFPETEFQKIFRYYASRHNMYMQAVGDLGITSQAVMASEEDLSGKDLSLKYIFPEEAIDPSPQANYSAMTVTVRFDVEPEADPGK